MYYNDPYANGNYGNGPYPTYPQGPSLNGGYPYLPGPQTTNSLAIAAFVLAMMQFFTVITVIPAIICGHIALGQIKQYGSSGRGLAIAALVISYVFLDILVLALTLILLGVFGSFAALMDEASGTGGSYAMALMPLLQV